ncbi:SMC-Scp complex subunit ScpB [Veillonella magna]
MPLDILAEVFSVTPETMEVALSQYEKALVQEARGIRIRRSGAGIELVTAPEAGRYVSRIRQREDKLSAAAMETLAVVAFKQPVTKAEIEEIRGVNSEKVLKQLLNRDLIAELGRKDTVGRPVLFGTTDTFLRSVGISSIDTLQREIRIQESLELSEVASTETKEDEVESANTAE